MVSKFFILYVHIFQGLWNPFRFSSLSTANVTVIDSSFTDQALKFQVVEAAKLAQRQEVGEFLSHVEEVKNKAWSSLLFLL